ncbi:hypothetical protein [Glycomyces xiaoerkulensis]|uniref:hypothetical protein n=1 Tax=Glycomyces xiaoerkulensis TaxID=2038139 RepID=UPI000C2665B9|nr:hypothetical protein [Glycomyces xiaoerkulensis]
MAVDRAASYDGVSLYKLVWRLVRDQGFDPRDFVLAGSARLWLEGVIPRLADIDIVARGGTWQRALRLAENRTLHNGIYQGENTGEPVAQLYGRRIDVCRSWPCLSKDADALIDHAEIISDLPHMTLADVVAYKSVLDRPKDRGDLRRLRHRAFGSVESPQRPEQAPPEFEHAVPIERLRDRSLVERAPAAAPAASADRP